MARRVRLSPPPRSETAFLSFVASVVAQLLPSSTPPSPCRSRTPRAAAWMQPPPRSAANGLRIRNSPRQPRRGDGGVTGDWILLAPVSTSPRQPILSLAGPPFWPLGRNRFSTICSQECAKWVGSELLAVWLKKLFLLILVLFYSSTIQAGEEGPFENV